MAPNEEPILFLWSLSAWAGKVTAYLALRGIPYTRCEQPITQPRPDLDALGVNYRRIPLLAIGRDIYCDSLLILEKLESIYGTDSSSKYKNISAKAKGGSDYALERLFEKWTDAVVFKAAAAVIPSSLDLMKDQQFQKDREELWGRSWGKAEQDALRPKGLADMRSNWDLLEATLSDGREWVLGTKEPMLADIHACWIFDWLLLLDSFDAAFFSPKTYPKTFAYRDRYAAAIKKAKDSAPQPPELSGPDAVSKILSSGFQESDAELKVEDDPESLKKGDEVEMWPIDTGFGRKDAGKLVGLNVSEMVVSTRSQQDQGKEVRIHYPRWNFEIKKAVDGGDGGGGNVPDEEVTVLN